MILHEIITTEKVPFTYRVAGIGSRFLAWLTDFGLILVLLFIGACFGSIVESARAGMGVGVFLASLFAVQFIYFIFFEWLWHGQTPGKYLLGIRVISWEGTGLSFLQSAGRNILRMVDGLPLLPYTMLVPFLYALGVSVAACNREQRRLGDIAAGTLVVHVERRPRAVYGARATSDEKEKAWRIQARQRLAQLKREQKQTLLDLCLRRDQLRLAERARMFRTTAEYFQNEVGLAPEQYQSDEKFILALGAEIGTPTEALGAR
jgi:uncharacterized RDD family membrane protein YckC